MSRERGGKKWKEEQYIGGIHVRLPVNHDDTTTLQLNERETSSTAKSSTKICQTDDDPSKLRIDFSIFMRQKLSDDARSGRRNSLGMKQTNQSLIGFKHLPDSTLPIDLSSKLASPTAKSTSQQQKHMCQTTSPYILSRNERSLERFLQIGQKTLQYFSSKNKVGCSSSAMNHQSLNNKSPTANQRTALSTEFGKEHEEESKISAPISPFQPFRSQRPQRAQLTKSQPNLAFPVQTQQAIKVPSQLKVKTNQSDQLVDQTRQKILGWQHLQQETNQDSNKMRQHYRTITEQEQQLKQVNKGKIGGETSQRNLSFKHVQTPSLFVEYKQHFSNENIAAAVTQSTINNQPSLAYIHQVADIKNQKNYFSSDSHSQFYIDSRKNILLISSDDQRSVYPLTVASPTIPSPLQKQTAYPLLQSLSQSAFFNRWVKQSGLKKPQPHIAKRKVSHLDIPSNISDQPVNIHFTSCEGQPLKGEEQNVSHLLLSATSSPHRNKYKIINAIAAKPAFLRLKPHENPQLHPHSTQQSSFVHLHTPQIEESPLLKRLNQFKILEDLQIQRVQSRINASKICNLLPSTKTELKLFIRNKQMLSTEPNLATNLTKTLNKIEFSNPFPSEINIYSEYQPTASSPDASHNKKEQYSHNTSIQHSTHSTNNQENLLIPLGSFPTISLDQHVPHIDFLKIDNGSYGETSYDAKDNIQDDPMSIIQKKLMMIERRKQQQQQQQEQQSQSSSSSSPSSQSQMQEEISLKKEGSRFHSTRELTPETSYSQIPSNHLVARSPGTNKNSLLESAGFAHICSNISELVRNHLNDSGTSLDINISTSQTTKNATSVATAAATAAAAISAGQTPKFQRKNLQRQIRRSVFVRDRPETRMHTNIFQSSLNEEGGGGGGRREENGISGSRKVSGQQSPICQDPEQEARIKQELSFFVSNLVKGLDKEADKQLKDDIAYFCTQDWSQFTFAMSQFLQLILKRKTDLSDNRVICPFKLCPSINKRLLDLFLAELKQLETEDSAIQVFKRLFTSHKEMIVPVSLGEKLGSERQLRRMVNEVVHEMIHGSSGHLFESYQEHGLVETHLSMLRFLQGQLRHSEDLKVLNAVDVFESKRLYLRVMRSYSRFYSEAVCFEFIEQIESNRHHLTHCVSLYRLAQEERLMANLKEYLLKIVAIHHLPFNQRDVVAGALLSYVFSARMTSTKVMKICGESGLNLTKGLLDELKDVLVSHLRSEREYAENPEYALTLEYKVKKLQWRVDSHPLKGINEATNGSSSNRSSKGLEVVFAKWDEQIEELINKKHPIIVYDSEQIRGTTGMFALIESYFAHADTFSVKDAIFAISYGREEAENRILEFWMEILEKILKKIDKHSSQLIHSEVQHILHMRTLLKLKVK